MCESRLEVISPELSLRSKNQGVHSNLGLIVRGVGEYVNRHLYLLKVFEMLRSVDSYNAYFSGKLRFVCEELNDRAISCFTPHLNVFPLQLNEQIMCKLGLFVFNVL